MTSLPPADATPSTPLPPPPGKRCPWAWIGVGILLLLGGGAAATWWWSPSPPAVDPPMPTEIGEREVRQAIEVMRQKVLESPRSGQAWGNLGMVLLAHLFNSEADRCFAEAARLDPAETLWPYARGVIALKIDPDHALDFLRQAVAGQSTPEQQSGLRLQLAEALLERQSLDEAEGLFRGEWESSPRNPRAALGLGCIAQARGNLDDAEKYLKVARASRWGRKTATGQLAAVALARGDRELAEKYNREVEDLGPDPAWPDPLLDPVMRLRVGRSRREREVIQLEEAHRFAEAAQMYQQLIQERPTALAYMGAGINLGRLRNYEQAVPLVREAVRLEPNNAQAQYTLAMVLFNQADRVAHDSPNSPEPRKWFREVIEHAQRAVENQARQRPRLPVLGHGPETSGATGRGARSPASGSGVPAGDVRLAAGPGRSPAGGGTGAGGAGAPG